MKAPVLFLTLSIGSFILPFTSKTDTPEEFLASYRSAMEAKDTNQIISMYYTVGCSEADKTMLVAMQKIRFSDSKIKDVFFQPLPANQQTIYVVNGVKYEPTYPPAGKILITYDKSKSGITSGSDGYSVINGKYYLTATKSTNLNWTGPKDQQLNIMALGKGQDTVQIEYKWNASGVNLTNTIKAPSVAFLGQFIESATVTSTNDNTDVTLTVREGGKEIYTSQELKGKGTLEYKKHG